MAFKMKNTAYYKKKFNESEMASPYRKGKTHLKAHEEGHDDDDSHNKEMYEGFLVGKNPQFRKSKEANEMGHYDTEIINDINDPAYDDYRKKFPYNPDINYENAKWKE